MASKATKITVKALQGLLTRIGSASSGSKDLLRQRFDHDIRTSRLFGLKPEWAARQRPDSSKKLRIVSIDMGIKNLAFCDVEVEYPKKQSLNSTMRIHRWEKVDLARTASAERIDVSSTKGKENERDKEEEEDTDMYSSSALSTTAYTLVKNTILTSNPDIILIEKQRWRSGGGSAVLQWTVRVNTLEGMLWAVLTTLRSEQRAMQQQQQHPKQRKGNAEINSQTSDFEIFAVDPKRVGQYWIGQSAASMQDDTLGMKKLGKSKMEKKARIDILRSWLTSTPSSTGNRPSSNGKTNDTSTPTITFNFSETAERIRRALCFPSRKPMRRSSKEVKKSSSSDEELAEDLIGGTGLKKLDDVTDCFLQAAAWVSWESNRLQLLEVLEKKEGRKGKGKVKGAAVAEGDEGISEEVLAEMVREVLEE